METLDLEKRRKLRAAGGRQGGNIPAEDEDQEDDRKSEGDSVAAGVDKELQVRHLSIDSFVQSTDTKEHGDQHKYTKKDIQDK